MSNIILPGSVIELSRKALQNNIDFIRERIGKKVVFSSVIKGNAYGHGIEQFVPMAIEAGVNHFSVFSADEAQRVVNIVGNKKVTIMIMGLIDNDSLEWAIRNKIEFFVFDLDRLKKAAETAASVNKKAIIHLEFETGMNRTGFNQTQLTKAINILKQHTEHIQLKGACTHFAGAENVSNLQRIEKQIKIFYQLLNKLAKQDLKPMQLHTNCSAAVISYPKMNLDLVRVGILQYGLWPSKETYVDYIKDQKNKTDRLKRLITWKSKIMSTKKVLQGEFIGYGSSFAARVDMKIAIIPIGYAHGYSRSLSNQGSVIVKGKPFSIIGIVNMNVLMIDITTFPQIKKGDEATLIGTDGEESISIASFSELSNQLNYEMLTRLPGNIPRKVVN
ncbi:MAG: alanine racemase [Bacteroidota bacterium]|nr:alanine racemase [Bacteroidota bacterium]